jgi:Tfp pilus assembly protein PilO
MKINLPPDIKIIVMPLASLSALLILGYLLISMGLTRILAQEKQVKSAENEVTILEQKNLVLNEVTPTIAQNANLFSFALPAEDPGPMIFSQIKSLSASAGVQINTLGLLPGAIGGEIREEVVNVKITGSTTAIFDFLNQLSTITPLVVVNTVIISKDKTDNVSADIALSSFWSAFPETIPASSDPVSDLTVDEKDMISQMATYKTPAFTELTPLSSSSSRTSPF